MRYNRTSEEALTDKATLLALLARFSSHSGASLGDRLNIQELTFSFCYRLFQRRIKALNYTFFTYRWGPFTKDLYEAEADFEQAGLMRRDGQAYSLTEMGQMWGNSLYDAISDDPYNCDIVEVMNAVIAEYANDVMGHVAKRMQAKFVMPIGWREEERLSELPYHLDLTGVLEENKATALLEIERGLLDSFAMMLSKSAGLQASAAL